MSNTVQNGKGSAQRAGLTIESRLKYDQINMLKEDEKWLLPQLKFVENVWIGYDLQGNEVCWAFSQRQCANKLKAYYGK